MTAKNKHHQAASKLEILSNINIKLPAYTKIIKEVVGICIGGCIVGKEYLKDHDGSDWIKVPKNKKQFGYRGILAHAHSYDDFHGWICSPFKLMDTKNNSHYQTLLHEIAHVIVENERGTVKHTKKWQNKFIELGGDPDDIKRYQKGGEQYGE